MNDPARTRGKDQHLRRTGPSPGGQTGNPRPGDCEPGLEDSEARLRLALQLAGLGTWEWNLRTKVLTCDEGLGRLYGLTAGGAPMTSPPCLESAHPEDRQKVERWLEHAFQTDKPPDIEFRALLPDGTVRWMAETVRVFRDAGGHPVCLSAVSRDVSQRKRLEEALRETQTSFANLLENLPGMVYRGRDDPERTLERISEGAMALFGSRAADLMTSSGLRFGDWIHPDDRGPAWDTMQAALKERRPFRLTYRFRDAAGIEKWLCEYGRGVFSARGEVLAVEGFITTINRRKRAEEALGESNKTLESLMRAIPLAVIALDNGGNVTIWNPAAEHIFGWSAAEVLGQPLPIIPPDKREEYQAIRAGELEGRPRVASEVRRRRKDGSLIDICLWTAAVRDARGAVRSTIGVLADVTDRKRADEQLKESNERFRDLSRRLLEVQEQERRHLARELHDEVGQVLTALQLTLSAMPRPAGDPLPANLAEAQALVKELTARVRSLSLRLRPTMLDDLGLLPALLWHVERFTAQTRVRVRLEHHGLGRRLFPPEVETAAYRIIQEALTNVARHARVPEAEVRVWLTAARLLVEVEDRGVGFTPEMTEGKEASSGLSGMRERACLLGGQLMLVSAPGSGTRLTAELPVQQVEERRRPAAEGFIGMRPVDPLADAAPSAAASRRQDS